MDSYYQILGVEKDADESTIKRAYFKAVRRYPPDRDPEKFKEVREAYEVLTDREQRALYDQTVGLDPVLRETYRHVMFCMNMGDYDTAAEYCEEASLRAGQGREVFMFLLGQIYLLNDNRGKAVKQYEHLCGDCPENWEYKKWLAYSYKERSWNKKSLGICAELENAGCTDADFLILYGSVLCRQKQYGQAMTKLQAAGEAASNKISADTGFMDQLWQGLIEEMNQFPKQLTEKVADVYAAYIEAYQGKKERLQISLILMLGALMEYGGAAGLETPAFRLLTEIAGQWKAEGVLNQQALWIELSAERKLEEWRLRRDDRIKKRILPFTEVMYVYSVMKEVAALKADDVERSYISDILSEELGQSVAQVKVAVIRELPGIKKELLIIKEEYPMLAESFGEFIDEVMKNNSRAFLLNKYEKKIKHPFMNELDQMLDFYDRGFDGDDEEDFLDGFIKEKPYRRESPKVGRNDPCPCGSGKKYKNCCGKNR